MEGAVSMYGAPHMEDIKTAVFISRGSIYGCYRWFPRRPQPDKAVEGRSMWGFRTQTEEAAILSAWFTVEVPEYLVLFQSRCSINACGIERWSHP